MGCWREDALGQKNDVINETLVSDDYKEEDFNGENCQSDEEEFWIDMMLE